MASSAVSPLHVVVAGAGPAGCFMALTLVRFHGCRVTLVERRRCFETSKQRSINLVLTTRGLAALQILQLEEETMSHALPIYRREVHPLDKPSRPAPYGLSKREALFSIQRETLQDILFRVAEKDDRIHIKLGWTLEGLRFSPSDTMNEVQVIGSAYTAQGGKAQDRLQADFVVCADGIGSVGRSCMLDTIRETEDPTASATVNRLGLDYKELRVPFTPKLSKHALHVWPRGPDFLMAIPDVSEFLAFILYLPNDKDEKITAACGHRDPLVPRFTHSSEKDFKRYFTDEYPTAPNTTHEHAQHMANTEAAAGWLATLSVTHWFYSGRAILLGDAAHAITPFFGQGVNMALESCHVLHRCLLQHSNLCDNDVRSKAFSTFTEWQKPNADAMARMALEQYDELAEGTTGTDRADYSSLQRWLEERFGHIFCSRYRMVTMRFIPYAVAEKAGVITHDLLRRVNNLLDHRGEYLPDVSEVTVSEIFALLKESMQPLLDEHHLVLDDRWHMYYPM